jgi:peptidoglycan/LPS O-acetylase OafA/YrhL
VTAAERPAARSSAHRTDIQGLRAIAVLLVALGHARVGFLGGGFVGVDVFFVLSGFLITGLLLAEARKTGSISLRDFYVRRARRILPAAALTLVVTDLASLVLLNFVRARTAVGDSVHAAAFSANFRFAARGVDYFAQADPPSPLLHFWSLSVEEQFYFVWPLLLSVVLFAGARAGASRRKPLFVVLLALAGASFVWSMHATATGPAAAYFSPFTRAWELGLGAALAVATPALHRVPARAKLALGWAGLLAVGLAAVAFSDRTPFPGSAALLPTLGTALAVVAGIGSTPSRFAVARFLSIRPLAFVGDRSYAYYLWHWPVLILAAEYAGHELPVATKLALLAAAFLVSCLSYAVLENPIRKRMKSPMRTVVVAAVCLAGVFGTAALSLAAIDREQQRFEGAAVAVPRVAAFSTVAYRALRMRGALPAVVAAVEAAERGDPLPQSLTPRIGQLRSFSAPYLPPAGCLARDGRSSATSRVCRMGHAGSRKLVVLLGDSHALEWLPPLLELARRDDWAVVPLLRLGCTPSKWLGKDATTCRAWYRWAVREAVRLHPQATLIGGSIDQQVTPTTRAAMSGVLATARTLRGNGHVAVIGDPEGLSQDPVDCLLSSHATMATCTATWPASALAPYDGIERGAKQLGIGFLETRGLLCFDGRCPAVIGNTIAWMDTNHMTVAYSVQVAGAFRAAFLAATKPR